MLSLGPLKNLIAQYSARARRTDSEEASDSKAAEDAPIFDQAVFDGFVRERRPKTVDAVLNIFADELRDKIQPLEQALRQGVVADVKSIAHSVRGSGAMLGAARMVELGRQIDEACNSTCPVDPQAVTALLEAMRATVDVFTKLRLERSGVADRGVGEAAA